MNERRARPDRRALPRDTPDRRGRPRSETPASTFLVIRLTAEQRRRLTAVASMNGMKTSAFVRQAVDEAASDCSDEPIFR